MMTDCYREYLKTNATAEELRAILGENWGICRKTPNNLERYARCITRKEYDEANKLAVSNRNA